MGDSTLTHGTSTCTDADEAETRHAREKEIA